MAMEATGIYSMPVYHVLIEHGQLAQVLVCNAGHVKNVPGRKSDLADAEWLAHLLECGLLRGSFIPPADIKAARDVIRYRTKVVQSRTSEVQRLGNVLQDAGIKIDSVASSIATKSGLAMIEALIDGERRPQVLADLAKGKMRAKIPDLELALEGRFDDHQGSDGTDGRWRIADKVAEDRVVSTVDPETRHARKSRSSAATATGRTGKCFGRCSAGLAPRRPL